MPLSKAVYKVLDLPVGSTEEQILTAVNQLKKASLRSFDEGIQKPSNQFVSRRDYDIALNRAQDAETRLKEYEARTLGKQIEEELKLALNQGIISSDTLNYHRACCRQEGGLERFRKFVKSVPKIKKSKRLTKNKPNASKQAA